MNRKPQSVSDISATPQTKILLSPEIIFAPTVQKLDLAYTMLRLAVDELDESGDHASADQIRKMRADLAGLLNAGVGM